ncbi:MmgE/PrpD family protein [Hoeflea alexandrii]|uniref:MmgE/PrpD family protein n=1 Tax=Hoeflea alexandrii TaxID=288436 RepID=UPI0022B033FC|nr:MmgE/PrpD family protein [Hoeflea alexandrii]MCZ4291013.1 MmgE/PrpD family protein [Hoeflea alexandrii]
MGRSNVRYEPDAETVPESTVSGRLAAIALVQGHCSQSPEVLHAAKRCLIDWFAATLPGTRSEQAAALEAGLLDELGHGDALTLSGKAAPKRVAALINGVASHAMEFDDIYSPAIYHPGSPVIAAALASAMGLRKTGRDLLNAVIAGYETSTRVGAALGRTHYRDFHSTGTVGTIGAAVAVGLLHDLDHDRLSHAISTSVTMAAGLQAAFRGDSGIKPLHAGHAADAGHVAVAMAMSGVIAPTDMFEGPLGIGVVMGDGVVWDRTTEGLTEYNITRTTIKNHGCCGHIFAALDGVLHLRQQEGFSIDEIEAIKIGGYSATVSVTGNYSADTPGAAKFCLPFIIASGLIYGSIRLDAYTPERLQDRQVRALMNKVTVALDPEVDALFPAQRAARVTIVLGDRTVTWFQPHRIGDPDLPLSDAQLNAKFMELSTGVLSVEKAASLLDLLWQVDRLADLGELARFLR